MTATDSGGVVGGVLALLDGVRQKGDSQWEARCPVHDDRDPSLSVGVGEDGRVLLNCFRGCDFENIVMVIGLSVADLFPASTRRGVEVVRRHAYCDEQGTVSYEVRRLRSAKGSLTWAYARPTSEGWKTGRGDAPKVLYQLPRLMAAEVGVVVWVTEGERDADTLTALGEVATTVASGSWAGVNTTALCGRRVHVVVDNDKTGWKKGTEAMKAAERAGGTVVAVFAPPEQFKDVSELVEAGCGLDDLRRVDLNEDVPPLRAEAQTEVGRPVVHSDGTPLFALVPIGLMLAFIQSKELRLKDIGVYAVFDHRAGESGVALLTAVDVADICKINRGTPGDSLDRLTAVGLIKETQRGTWKVYNPVRRRNDGKLDL